MNSQQIATLDTMTTVKGSESQLCSNGINSQLPILIDAPLMQIPAHPQHGWRSADIFVSQTYRAGMEPIFVSGNEINAPQSLFGPTEASTCIQQPMYVIRDEIRNQPFYDLSNPIGPRNFVDGTIIPPPTYAAIPMAETQIGDNDEVKQRGLSSPIFKMYQK